MGGAWAVLRVALIAMGFYHDLRTSNLANRVCAAVTYPTAKMEIAARLIQGE